MPNIKQNDAKVMYACLQLPKDAEAGEATSFYIKCYAGLSGWKVFRSLKRLLTLNYIKPGDKKSGHHNCYFVDDGDHITKTGTAWILEKIISWQHSTGDIILEEFKNNLQPPEKLSHLNDKNLIQTRINLLLDRGYIEKTDEPGQVRICKKTIDQRLYIELLANDIRLPALATYEFQNVRSNSSK